MNTLALWCVLNLEFQIIFPTCSIASLVYLGSLVRAIMQPPPPTPVKFPLEDNPLTALPASCPQVPRGDGATGRTAEDGRIPAKRRPSPVPKAGGMVLTAHAGHEVWPEERKHARPPVRWSMHRRACVAGEGLAPTRRPSRLRTQLRSVADFPSSR